MTDVVFINKKKISISDWSFTVFQLCDSLGVKLPRFCYHEKLSIAGNCRMCMVEVESSLKPIISCATSLTKGMSIITNSKLVKKAREGVLEFLLINHPLDCPICDQGGECDLQDQSIVYGADKGRFSEIKRSVEDKYFGPIIKTVMTRCIHCTRCVRFFEEVAGVPFLGTMGRGKETEISTYLMSSLGYSNLSGNVIDLCPVGALTSKPYAFISRPWDLCSVDSIDTLDSLCSSIRIDLKGLEVVRVLPRKNELVNEDWITDLTRYSFDGLSKQRLSFPLFYDVLTSSFLKKSWSHFFSSFITSSFSFFKSFDCSSSLLSIGSTLDLYSIYILSLFSKKLNRPMYDSSISYSFVNKTFRSNYLIGHYGLQNVEHYSSFILFQLNLNDDFSLVNTRIRTAIQSNINSQVLYIGKHISSSYDIKHLGLSTPSALRLLRGKQIYSSLLCYQKTAFLSSLNNLFSTLINTFNKSIFSSSISYAPILSNVRDVHLCELGISNDVNCVFDAFSPTFIYSLDSSTFFYKHSDLPFFYISQSTHASLHKSIKSELLTTNHIIWHLPVCSSFEESAPYMNILGLIQWTKKALDRYGFSQTHHYILFNLLILLDDNFTNLQTHILYDLFIEKNPQIESSFGCFFSFKSFSFSKTTYFVTSQKELPMYADYSLTLQRINSFKLNRMN